MKRMISGLLVLAGLALAQSPTMPTGQIVRSGVPGALACSIGQHYFQTNAVAGTNLWVCTALPSTWTLAGGVGSVTGSGVLNFLPRWDVSTTNLVDSGLSDNGTTVTLAATRSMSLAATTSATTGIIFKGIDRFIHNYKPAANVGSNTFGGLLSGNFTMTSVTATLASYNTGFGEETLSALTSGSKNTAMGFQALTHATTGYYNTGIGEQALTLLTTGYFNTGIGEQALTLLTTGLRNTGLGWEAGHSLSGGSDNTAVGAEAMRNSTGATFNTAVGTRAMYNTAGPVTRNVAVGHEALFNTGDAEDNVGVGYQALAANTTGDQNTALGASALMTSTTTSYNTAVGFESLKVATGQSNTAVGHRVAVLNTTGANNVAVGTLALSSNTTTSDNTAVGAYSLSANVAANNTGVGNSALYSTTSGADNTAAGYQAGYTETAGNANTTGAQNVWLGSQSGPGSVTQITNSIGIGYRAHPLVSNEAVLGNASITLTRLRGAVQWTTIAEGTCAAALRGQVVYVAGAAGVADSFRICQKNSSDVYSWGSPEGAVPSWAKYSLVAIANGVNGCANANGCWQVNGVLGAIKTAGLTQDVVLAALPANWQVSDWSVKTAVVCTGAATALSGLGVTANNALFRAQTYDIAAAVAATNLTTGPTAAAGANTAAGTNLIASLITTVNNVDQLVTGCTINYHVLWGVRP